VPVAASPGSIEVQEPLDVPLDVPKPDHETAGDRYAYRASLVGSAHALELTDDGLSWHIGGRSGIWPMMSIASIRLSYRPISMQSRRFRADIETAGRERIVVLSRLAQAGSQAVLTGGLRPGIYAAAVVLLALLAMAMAGLLARAVATGEFAGSLFLVGFAALFAWQIGGFIRRNRPRTYRFDDLPKDLLP
jgi:hypothetical protein